MECGGGEIEWESERLANRLTKWGTVADDVQALKLDATSTPTAASEKRASL